MGNKRDLKRLCYIEALEDNVVGVEMILNRFNQIEDKKGIFDSYILTHDKTKTTLDLELSLATLCILLRKMSENLMVVIPSELRRDMNSIIHSNRFEYNRFEVVVYSQKGRELVDLRGLLRFCHSILDSDKVRK
ncbi:hypothetical protein NMU03_08810 [Allocoprobacillus halotolerans]|uniref:Uncharacterized protein n=1 Tax=Allocoprobacillus halotolerans TaxID=2944914 RepID=A0ABY5I173_9FIRM|nr:hypothetical protein [Allocoprobacillus halotolerans]UTY37828.1 hypothetical protein NMU03_08810 [Allocoprobacillus halotolerans]